MMSTNAEFDKAQWWKEAVQLHDEIHAGQDSDADCLEGYITYDQNDRIGRAMRSRYVDEMYGKLVSKHDKCAFLLQLARYGVSQSESDLQKLSEIEDREVPRLMEDFSKNPDGLVEGMAKLESFVEVYGDKHSKALDEWRSHLTTTTMHDHENQRHYERLKALAEKTGYSIEPLALPKHVTRPPSPGLFGDAA